MGEAGQGLVVDHQPEWIDRFREERARLAEVFAGVPVTIEHVGSTAVLGLAAKPIVDICVGLESLEHAEARVRALATLGYEYVPEYEAVVPDRRYFRRPVRRPRTHHVHCVVRGGEFWERHLRFRDHLRKDPATAAEYGALKKKLAARFAHDRPAYTEGKTPFIERVLEEAGP